MKNWKRRWALFLTAVLLALSLTGCGGSGEGLALSVCVGGAPEELDPIYATETADQTVLVHLYENLMRKTGDGSGGTTVTNGAAKSVSTEENADGTVTWTFKLRKAEWSDGRAVRAGDFVFAWQRLADPANDSPSASLLSVVAGYDAVRETGDVSLLQVTAEDDSTLVVVLNGKFDWFLTEVCTAPATMPLRQDLLQEETTAADGETAEAAEEPAEAAPWWNDLTGLVTNGPYQVSGYEAGEALTLEASETYRNSLSGPQTLTFRFAETAEAGQDLYDAGEVDFLGILPAEQLTDLIEAESRTLAPELSVQAVVFNCAQDTLMDARVRRALTLTADRSAAAEAAGAAAYAAEGLIPPGVPGSGEQDFRTDGGALLDNDPAHRDELAEEARSLLAEAGYAEARDLGELEYLYVDEGSNAAVAQALVDAWQSALGLQVTARGVSREELDTALREGTFTLAGTEIRAVGNDAECFLMQWGSAKPENLGRYANSAYDTLLSVIAGAEEGEARMGCLHDAEALLLEEGAAAPLYTTVTGWTLRDGLSGVLRDARGWFSFAAAGRTA